jgi:hypothetical protein
VVTALDLNLAAIEYLLKRLRGLENGRGMFERLALGMVHRFQSNLNLSLPKRFATIVRGLEAAHAEIYVPIELEAWTSRLPFACPEGWVHLNCVDAVIQEGRVMKNCLRAPAHYLQAETYLFRVEHPVRATVWVIRLGDAGYRIEECRGVCNVDLDASVKKEMELALRNALAFGGETAA